MRKFPDARWWIELTLNSTKTSGFASSSGCPCLDAHWIRPILYPSTFATQIVCAAIVSIFDGVYRWYPGTVWTVRTVLSFLSRWIESVYRPFFPLDRIESFAKKRCAGTANCIKKHNFTKKRKLREFTSNSYDATGACPLLQNKFNTGNVKLTILFMFIVFSAQIPTTITTRTKKGLNWPNKNCCFDFH